MDEKIPDPPPPDSPFVLREDYVSRAMGAPKPPPVSLPPLGGDPPPDRQPPSPGECEPSGRKSRRTGKPMGRPPGRLTDRLRDPDEREDSGKKSRAKPGKASHSATQVPGDWSIVAKGEASTWLAGAQASQGLTPEPFVRASRVPADAILDLPMPNLGNGGTQEAAESTITPKGVDMGTDGARVENSATSDGTPEVTKAQAEQAIARALESTNLPSLQPPDIVAKEAFRLVNDLYKGDDFKNLSTRIRVYSVQRMIQLSQCETKDLKVPYLAAIALLNIADRLAKNGTGGAPGTIDEQGNPVFPPMGSNGLTEL